MAVSALSDALLDIEGAVGGIFGATAGKVDTLFTGLGQLSFALVVLMWFVDGRPAAHGPLIKMIFKIMAIGWLIDVFPVLSNKIITGMLDLSGEVGAAGFSLRDPGAVGLYGLEMAGPILERAKELVGFPDFFFTLPVIFLYLLSYLGCIIAFFIIAIQLFMTWLEWRFLSVAAFFCLPFAILAPTSFIAERAIGYVASTGIKVFSIGLVIGISTIAMANVNEEAMSVSLALGAVVLSAAICIMALKIPAAAAGLVNGGPVGSAMDAVIGLAVAAKAGMIASKAAGVATGGAMVGAGKVMQSWGGAGAAAAAGGAAGAGLGATATSAGPSASGAATGAGAGAAAAGGRSYPGRMAAMGASMTSAGQSLAAASGWRGGGGAAGGTGAGAAGGTAGAAAGPNSSWFQAPTQAQQNFANSVGVNLSGLNRAQATAALAAAGHGGNLAQGSAQGQMAQAVGSSFRPASTGGATSGGGSGYSPAAQQAISSAKSTVAADEARYAAMAADPAVGNATAQSLRSMAHHNTAEQTAIRLQRDAPAASQQIFSRMATVDSRVQSAISRGVPAETINAKSADDYRNIVNSL